MNEVSNNMSELLAQANGQMEGLSEPIRTKKAALGQQDFMKLLVTQLSSQNPLNPESPGDFLTDLAMFGTVDGIGKLNDSMGDLKTNFNMSQSMQAAALVDKQAWVEREKFTNTGEPIHGAIPIPVGASNMSVSIQNTKGEVVKNIELKNLEPGMHRFVWDGKGIDGAEVPQGDYRWYASLKVNEKELNVPLLIGSKVNGVSVGNTGDFTLNLAGVGQVPFSAVHEIN